MERGSNFNPAEVDKLFKPEGGSKNGQITIIGGSELFHGAPLLSLTVASKIVDMVFFSSPDPSVGEIANSIKSKLFSFIWVPWEDVGNYIEKSDAVLMGPGLMRFGRESQITNDKLHDQRSRSFTNYDRTGSKTRRITQDLLVKFPDKKWVIDAGSLQVLEKSWIPEGAILTPNVKEYSTLFNDMDPGIASAKYKCTIILKGVIDRICSNGSCVEVTGGNAGMAKGGTGDTLAGLTVALFAKNDAHLAASCASYITKKAGDALFENFRTNFNADDLAQKVPEILGKLQKKK